MTMSRVSQETARPDQSMKRSMLFISACMFDIAIPAVIVKNHVNNPPLLINERGGVIYSRRGAENAENNVCFVELISICRSGFSREFLIFATKVAPTTKTIIPFAFSAPLRESISFCRVRRAHRVDLMPNGAHGAPYENVINQITANEAE